MRVLHVTHSLRGGGAGIAAHRIFEAVRGQTDIETHLVTTSVLPGGINDAAVNYFRPRKHRLNTIGEHIGLRMQKSVNPVHRTLGLFDSGLGNYILSGNWDLVHLHWVGLGTLSTKEIGKIAKRIPTVWTLHDSWAFCGAEHHPHFEADERFARAYSRSSRAQTDSYLDIDRFIFQRKLKHWRSPISLIAPTHFMADQARRSTIARTWPVTMIPHPIDPETFLPQSPTARLSFRTSVGLNPRAPTVLFASSPGSDFNKGLDLLVPITRLLRDRLPEMQMVTIGGPWTSLPDYVLQYQPVTDEKALANWLSAVDLVIVPSRLESFSLVAAEAQMCGTPVISFDTSGLRDVVGARHPDRLIPQWDWRQMAIRVERHLIETIDAAQGVRDLAAGLWEPDVVGEAYAHEYRRFTATRALGKPYQ